MVVAETLAKLLTSNSLDLKRKKHPMEQPHFLRLHYCSLKDSGYEQNKNVVWSQGFFFHILTLSDAGGGGQNDPLVRRSPAISHRIMLWSQKFLTLSINISTRRY